MLKAAVANTLLALVLSSQTAYAIEATEKTCADALGEIGLPSEGYLLDEGFFSDTHTFGGNIECTDSGGHLKIKSGGSVIAEDGFYGKSTLAARNAAQASQREQIEALKAERDEKESIAEREYKEARAKVEEETKGQLEQIRNNDIPASIATAVSLERESVIAESKRKAEESRLKEIKQREEKHARALRDIEKEKIRVKEKAEREKLAATEKSRKSQEAAEERAKERLEKVENNRKGFHCLGGWNGDQRYVTKAIKENLNDPSSFDHEETRVAPIKDGRHSFIMTYRAKNGFGALVLGTAKGSYSNSDCSDVQFTSTN